MSTQLFRRVLAPLGAGLAAFLLLSGCEAGGSSPTILIRMGHVGTPGSLYDQGAQKFKEIVEARGPGRVEVRVFPSSQLGGDQEMLNGLRLGTLEMHVPSSVLHAVDPLLGIFDAPFLIENREQLERVIDGPLGERIRDALRGHGLELLAFWENGFRVITNGVRPIVTPEDLRGIKLRTPKDPERVRLFQLLGANPTSMPFGELYTALRQGVVDGQENPLTQIVSARIYEVQKYLSVSRHVYSPAYPIMARDFFASLPADVQDLLRDAAREVGKWERDMGAAKDEEYLEFCRRHMEIVEIDRPAFLAAVAPMHDELRRRFGDELFEAVRGKPADGELAVEP